jgi:hypothetical protein
MRQDVFRLDLKSDEGINALMTLMDNDLQDATSNHDEVMEYVESSRDEYNAIGYKKSPKGKSGFVSKSIRKIVEAALPSITEPFINKDIVEANGIDIESEAKAEVVTSLLNYQWNLGFKPLPFIEQINKDLMIDGTVFIKVGWDNIKDSPITEICDIDSLVIDPSATVLEEARFVIERKKVSISDILSNPEWYGEHTLESLSVLEASNDTEISRPNATGYEDDYNYQDRQRQLVDVNTYYGLVPEGEDGKLIPIVGIWSEETYLNAMPSPFPDSWRGIPFECEVYSRVTGSVYGESLAQLLADNQKIETQLQRSIFDTLDASTNGQRGFKVGSLDPINKRKFKAGKDFEYNTNGLEIWEGAYNPISSDIYNLKDRTQQDSEELSGISRLNAGLDPRALNSNVSATAASLVNSAAERRLLLLARHNSSLLEGMFRKWLDLNMMMLENGSVKVGGRLIPVSGFDIDGNYDLLLTIATQGASDRKVQQLGALIPQLYNNPDIPKSVTMGLTAELVKAMGLYSTADKLNNISKQMEVSESRPQEVDPITQASVELDMYEKNAEIAAKSAKASLDEAKAQGIAIDNVAKFYD